MSSQEEIEYTRALDDQEGNSFWRPSLLQYQDVTFYLQVGPSKLTTNHKIDFEL